MSPPPGFVLNTTGRTGRVIVRRARDERSRTTRDPSPSCMERMTSSHSAHARHGAMMCQQVQTQFLGGGGSKMTKSDEAVALFRSGFNCAQAILRTYGADLGLTPHDALKLASGFGAGMRRGATCGTVTGA